MILFLIMTFLIRAQKLDSNQIESRNEIIKQCIEMQLSSDKIEKILSLGFRESSFNQFAFNPVDSSAGMFGETEIFVLDCSCISKNNYRPKDRYNLRKSLEMLEIYLDYYTDWTLRNICFMWHRSRNRQENIDYYNKIKSETKIARQ